MNARTPQRFLAKGEYDLSAYDEAVITAAEKLVQRDGKCDPLEATNFDEAIGETLSGLPNSGIACTLAAALRAGEPVNKLLTDMTEKYWWNRALEMAQDDIEDERERALEDRAERMLDD